MNPSKEKIAGIIGTTVFHLIVIILLFFFYIKPTSIKRDSQLLGGVPVMFGNVQDALGNSEPLGDGTGETMEEITTVETENMPEEEVASATTESKKQPAQESNRTSVVTQDFEETVAVKQAKKKEDEKRKKEALLAETEKKNKALKEKKAAEEADKKNAINNQMAGLFGNGSGNGSRGNTSGSGTQGVPTGNASQGKTSGIGGNGTYDLGGRSVGSGGLVQPAYTVDDYGTVVVDIIVNPAGSVVEATIGRRTNTTNPTLQNESLKAARKTKFNAINSAGNQKGTITYKFHLK